jgi:ADP-ribose pyrophosphatase YjhB (NUDIX family)
MQLIEEINEADLGINFKKMSNEVRIRESGRGLVFDGERIALIKASKLGIYKLPGGGIKEDESAIEGFSREVFEETGCIIDGIDEVGTIVEYRDSLLMMQISYVYKGNVVEKRRELMLTDKEIGEGFELVWRSISEALKLMRIFDNPRTYAARFIYKRDRVILDYYCKKFLQWGIIE